MTEPEYASKKVGNRRVYLLVIVVVAFVLRIGFWWGVTVPDFPDSKTYQQIADNILNGKGFMLSENAKVARAPAYPLFLAGSAAAFGRSDAVIVLLQCIVSAFSCLVIYAIGKEVFGEMEGLIAAGLMCIYPVFAFYSATILTETVFILLLLVLILCVIQLKRTRKTWMAVASGIAFGVGVLTRPSLLLMLPLVWIFLLLRRKYCLRGIWNAIVMTVAVSFVMMPWVVRNYRAVEHFVPTTLKAGASLYEANSPVATGGPMMHRPEMWPEEVKSMGEYEADRYMLRLALKYIREHPVRTLQLGVVKFARTWSPIPNHAKFRTKLICAVSVVSYVPVMLLAVAGVVMIRRRFWECAGIVIPVVYFTLLHCVFVGSIRYRAPIIPYVILLAAYPLSRIICRRKVTE